MHYQSFNSLHQVRVVDSWTQLLETVLTCVVCMCTGPEQLLVSNLYGLSASEEVPSEAEDGDTTAPSRDPVELRRRALWGISLWLTQGTSHQRARFVRCGGMVPLLQVSNCVLCSVCVCVGVGVLRVCVTMCCA